MRKEGETPATAAELMAAGEAYAAAMLAYQTRLREAIKMQKQ
jgi:hypothetical protein